MFRLCGTLWNSEKIPDNSEWGTNSLTIYATATLESETCWNWLCISAFHISWFHGWINWIQLMNAWGNGTHLEFQHFQRSRLPGLPCLRDQTAEKRIDFSDRRLPFRMSWDGPQLQWMCIPVIRLVVLNMMYMNYIYIYVVLKCYDYIYIYISIGIYKGDIAYEPHLITDSWNAAPSRMDKNCVFYGSSTANRVWWSLK